MDATAGDPTRGHIRDEVTHTHTAYHLRDAGFEHGCRNSHWYSYVEYHPDRGIEIPKPSVVAKLACWGGVIRYQGCIGGSGLVAL